VSLVASNAAAEFCHLRAMRWPYSDAGEVCELLTPHFRHKIHH
jgi:hypothetical protein